MNLRLKGKVEIVYILLMFYGFILTGCQDMNITEPTSEEVTIEIVSTELNTDETATNETTISATVSVGETTSETLVEKSTETTSQSTNMSLEEWIDRIVWISGIRPNIAYLYDINRDNLPELVISVDEERYNCTYNVFNIFGENPRMLCILEACQYNSDGFINENNFDLYYDERENEYFYISTIWLDLKQMVVTYKHTICCEEIFTKKLAQYNYNMEGQNFYVTKGLFLEEEVIEPGYYNHDEINQLLGVTDYLNQYTLVEKNVQMGEGITEEAELKEQLVNLCTELNISEQNLKKVDSTSAYPSGVDIDFDSWIEFFVHKKSLDKNGNEVWALWKDYAGTYIEMGLLEVTPDNRVVEFYVDDAENYYILNRYIVNGKNEAVMYALTDEGLKAIGDVTEIDDKKYRFIRNIEMERNEISEDVNPEGPSVILSDTTTLNNTESDDIIYLDDKIEGIIQFIQDKRIDNAGLYDFNHDGQPELVQMSMGEYFGENYYDIYEITEQQLKYLGCISAGEFNYCNEFALYKNNETNKLFYLADYMRVEGTNNIVKTNIITFENGKMLINELANYTYIWDPELYEQGMINVSESGFMDKINPITGIQNITEINGLLGITDYLKSYEKIETMHFEALWGYDFNETAKEVLKQELLKGYSEK